MHPKTTIFAIAGPIIIGIGCIIEEGVIIVNRFAFSSLDDSLLTDVPQQEKGGDENRQRQPL